MLSGAERVVAPWLTERCEKNDNNSEKLYEVPAAGAATLIGRHRQRQRMKAQCVGKGFNTGRWNVVKMIVGDKDSRKPL